MKSICVYCGSKMGRNPAFEAAAKQLGQSIAEQNIRLVYGGANIGLMGTIANTALAHGAEVLGVIPKGIEAMEVSHHGLTELVVVENMHERKARMATEADAFIALPGGLGTLEELFEMWTWAQLGFHQKPLGLINTEGYYDALLHFISTSVEQGFVKQVIADLLFHNTCEKRLLQQLMMQTTALR